MTTNSNPKKFIVGRLTKDVREITTEKGKFLAFSVATDRYDANEKKNVTVFVDCTLNRYGAGLVPLLVRGTEVALFGLSGTRSHEGKTYETLMVDRLSLGNAMFERAPADAEGKVFAGVVGRLGKDAVERGQDDKKFLSFSIATEAYNKDAGATETVWLDGTLNRYGPGLLQHLVKGTNIAVYGMYVEKADEKASGGIRRVFYVNDFHFFGNKKPDAAPAAPDDKDI